MAISYLGTIIIFFLYLFFIIHREIYSHIWKALFPFFLSIVGIWFFFRIVLYAVFATEKYLEVKNFRGKTTIIAWDEIIAVQKPRFGVPSDVRYVRTEKGNKFLLIPSMRNYEDLIGLIKSRAPNLKIVEK